MIVNEFAGSGGDAMPWYFRKAGIGPLVGNRTWGGLVGIYDYPQLIDGGGVTAPRVAIYGLKGDWEVENHGITPDVEVDMDPGAGAPGPRSAARKSGGSGPGGAQEESAAGLQEARLPELSPEGFRCRV